jgi:hypothetical protein
MKENVKSLSRRDALLAGVVGLSAAINPRESIAHGVSGDTPYLQAVPGTGLKYYLIPYDENGVERRWSGVSCSEQAARELARLPITDVFLFSHGWQGDVPAAKDQYNRWIATMADCRADWEAMRRVRPDFLPLLIGLHWPSLPFGDEELRGTSVGAGSKSAGVDENLVELYASRIADTRRSRQALRTVLANRHTPQGEALSPEVAEALRALQQEAGLRSQGVAGAPGADCEAFDPQRMYRALRDERVGRIGGSLEAQAGASDLLVDFLRTLSFWKMKDRARQFGESGGRRLLTTLQSAVPGNRSVRFHLMGHSFGCIVVSATLAGVPGSATSSRPINSLTLVQGALSLWSYCSRIPYSPATRGYFRSIIDRQLVNGPIITTQSSFDTAVGKWYPLAAGVARQVAYATQDQPVFPKYAGVGAFGLQGEGLNLERRDILPITASYGFRSGGIYNLECSTVIRNGDAVSGAHSDICHPEVAHAIWEAATVESPAPRPPPLPPPPAPRPPSPEPRRRILPWRRR